MRKLTVAVCLLACAWTATALEKYQQPPKAILDVLSEEPPPPGHPLVGLDNCLLTPHCAGPTWDSWPKRFRNGFANIERVLRGEAPWWVVL